jgi:hypothetical protein
MSRSSARLYGGEVCALLGPNGAGLRNLRLPWSATGRGWPPPALDDALDLAGLAAVPVIAGLATAPRTGHRDGSQGGLFGAAGTAHLGAGIAAQTAAITAAVGVSVHVLLRRDPAA